MTPDNLGGYIPLRSLGSMQCSTWIYARPQQLMQLALFLMHPYDHLVLNL